MNASTIMIFGYDGYIGYPLAMRLLKKGHRVIGIDNYSRRANVFKMGSMSATQTDSPEDRMRILREMGDFIPHIVDIHKEDKIIDYYIEQYKPGTVINLAHMPSAPYSQMDLDHSNHTLINNIIGTNNILWAIKNHTPCSHYITIGSTGEYSHYSNIDIEEGTFKFEHNGRQSELCIFPRAPGSVYHMSKVGSTYLIDFLTRTWKLRCTDVMQAVVFGGYTPEIIESKSPTRLDSDEAFGTVLNRFVVQALLDIPLTIYGEGKHKRGFIALNDSLQALEIAIENPADKGIVQTWNQLSEWHSMNDIADMVLKVASEKGIMATKSHIPTPRTEITEDHYYKYVTEKLPMLGYKPTRTIEQEIKYLFDTLELDDVKKCRLKKVVMPKIKWNK